MNHRVITINNPVITIINLLINIIKHSIYLIIKHNQPIFQLPQDTAQLFFDRSVAQVVDLLVLRGLLLFQLFLGAKTRLARHP